DIYNIISNADFPFPTVTLSDGQAVRIDHSGYSKYRSSRIREDRKLAMSSFLQALGSFRGTFGTTLNGSVQKTLFYLKARHYATSLEMALDGPNIPTSVYHRLVEGVNRHLPSFHRYLALRQRMLDVDRLCYYDLYAPLVASVDIEYTPT